MLRLDRSRPFGEITPPWSGDNGELPRPAAYEQDGRLFDAHDQEIVLGARKPKRALPSAPVAEPAEEEAPLTHAVGGNAGEQEMSPPELLARADTIAYARLVKEAKRILGPDCPKGKEAIKLALQEAIAGYEQRRARRQEMAWGGMTGQQEPQGLAPTPAVEAAKSGILSKAQLGMWARGREQYLFGDVTKAIRAHFGRQISSADGRRDAIDFLIEEKLITAAEARKDV